MFCNKCGNKIEESMKFCPICGAQVSNITIDSPKTSTPSIDLQEQTVSLGMLVEDINTQALEDNDILTTPLSEEEVIVVPAENNAVLTAPIKEDNSKKIIQQPNIVKEEIKINATPQQRTTNSPPKKKSGKNIAIIIIILALVFVFLVSGVIGTIFAVKYFANENEPTEITTVPEESTNYNNETTEKVEEVTEPEFLEANETDFEELKTTLPIIYPINFNCTTLKTDFFVDNMITTPGGLSTLYMYYFEGYPSEDCWDREEKYFGTEPDPKRMFTEYDDFGGYYCYLRIPKKNVKWLCEDVFNAKFDESYVSEDSYVYGDYVYRGIMTGLGDAGWDEYDIIEYPVVDGKYQITVKHYFCYDDVNGVVREHLSTKQITAKIKTKDNGERFWSFYEIKEI